MDLGSFGSSKDSIFRCIQVTIANIVKDSIIEQYGILRNDTNVSSKRLLGNLGDILTINVDSTWGGIVESEKKT